MDIDQYTIEELKNLQAQISGRIKKSRDEEILELAKMVKASLARLNCTLSDLFPEVVPAAAYRHPHKPGLTWTGKGRRPKWLRDALEDGVTLEQCQNPNKNVQE